MVAANSTASGSNEPVESPAMGSEALSESSRASVALAVRGAPSRRMTSNAVFASAEQTEPGRDDEVVSDHVSDRSRRQRDSLRGSVQDQASRSSADKQSQQAAAMSLKSAKFQQYRAQWASEDSQALCEESAHPSTLSSRGSEIGSAGSLRRGFERAVSPSEDSTGVSLSTYLFGASEGHRTPEIVSRSLSPASVGSVNVVVDGRRSSGIVDQQDVSREASATGKADNLHAVLPGASDAGTASRPAGPAARHPSLTPLAEQQEGPSVPSLSIGGSSLLRRRKLSELGDRTAPPNGRAVPCGHLCQQRTDLGTGRSLLT